MAIVKRTFSIPEEISHKLDENIPQQEKSRFVSNILAEALRRQNKEKLLKLLDELEPSANAQNDESVVDIIRGIRQQRSKRLVNNS
jgi:gamma-glutamyl:cysteine ligase YbdK (ATP-grasp superfamily)